MEDFSQEVFQVKYMKVDGQQCHLVGLREFSDKNAADFFAEESIKHSASMVSAISSEGRIQGEQLLEVKSNVQENAGHQVEKVSLDIDIDEMKVAAASAPLEGCIGMPVADLFPLPHTLHLLERLRKETNSQSPGHSLRSTTYTFEDMPMAWGADQLESISGTMKVTRTVSGPHVVMSFATQNCVGQSFSPVARIASDASSTGSSPEGSIVKPTASLSL